MSKSETVHIGLFCMFPLHAHYAVSSLIHCTKTCMETPGCYSFNFRPLDGSTGECVTVAPSGGENLDFEPEDENEWSLYYLPGLINWPIDEWTRKEIISGETDTGDRWRTHECLQRLKYSIFPFIYLGCLACLSETLSVHWTFDYAGIGTSQYTTRTDRVMSIMWPMWLIIW